MVRLLRVMQPSTASSESFNPTMVRLLQLEELLQRKWEKGFNPTMVRLLR